MDSIVQDVRHALRALRRAPGFSLAVVLTLALGIGGNAVVFSVMRAALQRQPPYPDPARLAMVNLTIAEPGEPADTIGWSYPKYLTMRHAAQSLESAAAIWTQEVTLSGASDAERSRLEVVTPEYFGLLGLRPAIGRVFGPEVESGDARVIVLGDALWRRRFAADPAVVGSTISIEGHPFTVIGVMPAESRGLTGRGEGFIPIAVLPVVSFPRILQQRQAHRYEVVGRIRAGVTMEQARAEMPGVGRVVAEAHPAGDAAAAWSAALVPFLDARINPVGRSAMRILAAGVAIVLLIACVNVANLMLARMASREREIAVRSALGAGRFRLARQAVAESVVLALAGGGLGVVIALWGSDWLAGAMPSVVGGYGSRGLEFLHESAVRVDLAVVAFAAMLSAGVGLVLGLAPLARFRRADASSVLRGGAPSRGMGLRRLSGRAVLVATEVALAFVLLAGAGLVSRSLSQLTSVDTGFDREGVVTFRYRLPRTLGDSLVPRAHGEVLARLAALPGVGSVGLAGSPELSGEFDRTLVMRVAGRAPLGREERIAVGVHYVNADYFRTLGIPLRDGRTFLASDVAGANPVMIIGETTARRLFPGQRAVGQRFAIGLDLFGDSLYGEVVGVAADVRHVKLGNDPIPDVYVHYPQYSYGDAAISLRSSLNEATLIAAARRVISEYDAGVPVYDVRTLRQRVHDATARERVLATALAAFGALALVLASLGVYGVISYSVARRTREVGVRMALGAARGRVLRLVVGEGMVLVGIGVVLGLAGAFAATRVLRSMLYGVGVTDPLTFAAMAVVLAGVALVATLLPALRASRVDPMTALRSE